MLIPRYFVFIALIAWIAAFAGLIHHLLSFKATATSAVRNA
jgi:hypothetical protein